MKYKLLIIWLSSKWMFRVNLGDQVWYEGKKYTVCNGVMPNSWRLGELATKEDEGWRPRKDCRKSWTPQNMFGSFQSGYRFYMGYWYDIWKHEGIKDWMKTLSIW